MNDLSRQLVSSPQQPAPDNSTPLRSMPTCQHASILLSPIRQLVPNPLIPGPTSHPSPVRSKAARTRLTPQQWGQARAALAPPWSDRQWREALACLGIRINDQ